MKFFECKSSCNLTELITFKITSNYEINHLRQFYARSTSECSIYLCNLLIEMNSQAVYDILSPNSSSSSMSFYIYPYNPSSDLARIYSIFMKSINKTDDTSIIDYNKCAVMPKNNETVYILKNKISIF
jgi:hypothetical protein